MLDVLLPVSIPNADLVPELLGQLESSTDVPTRIIVIVDGGRRTDFVQIEGALRGGGLEWVLLHEEAPRGMNYCIREAIAAVQNPFVAFVLPHVHLHDVKWFGKMQQVFLADQITGIVDTSPNTQSSSQAPVKRQVHRMPDPGCPLALLSGRFIKGAVPPRADEDPVAWWARQAIETGGATWHAGGVAYTTVEHDEHPRGQAWPEPSGSQDLSESPSPTIPASSTLTTTGMDGSPDFEL